MKKLFLSTIILLIVIIVNLFTCERAGAECYYFVAAHDAPSHVQLEADFTCDGINDQEQINQALNFISPDNPLTNRRVLLSSGTFSCGSAVSCSNKSVTLQGQGPSVTKIEFAQGGVALSFTDWRHKVSVRDLSIITSEAGGSTGLHLNGPPHAPMMMDKMAYVSNVNIDSKDRTHSFWSNGLILKNIAGGVVTDVQIFGNALDFSAMNTGIFVNGRSIDNVLRNISIWFADKGVYVWHQGQHPDDFPNIEGLRIYNPLIVNVDHGIFWNTPFPEPDLQVHGGHINAYSCGIRGHNISQLYVHGTNISRVPKSQSDFVGINIASNCHNVKILGVTLTAHHAYDPNVFSRQTTDYGIITRANYSFISNNFIAKCHTAIVLDHVHKCTVMGNSGVNNQVGIELLGGANNLYTGLNLL